MSPKQYRIKFRKQISRCFLLLSLAPLAGVSALGVSSEGRRNSRTYHYDYLTITTLLLAMSSEEIKSMRFLLLYMVTNF